MLGWLCRVTCYFVSTFQCSVTCCPNEKKLYLKYIPGRYYTTVVFASKGFSMEGRLFSTCGVRGQRRRRNYSPCNRQVPRPLESRLFQRRTSRSGGHTAVATGRAQREVSVPAHQRVFWFSWSSAGRCCCAPAQIGRIPQHRPSSQPVNHEKSRRHTKDKRYIWTSQELWPLWTQKEKMWWRASMPVSSMFELVPKIAWSSQLLVSAGPLMCQFAPHLPCTYSCTYCCTYGSLA